MAERRDHTAGRSCRYGREVLDGGLGDLVPGPRGMCEGIDR